MPAAWLLFLASISTAAIPQQSTRLSVGEVVRLSTAEPAKAVPQLREALAAHDPRVRAAAARVVAGLSARELWPPLVAALAKEQDPFAGAEQIRAMLILQRASAVDLAEPQAQRLGGAALRVLLEWLAANDPPRLAQRLSSVPPGDQDVWLLPAIQRAVDSAPAIRLDLVRAWRDLARTGEWSAVLSRALRTDDDLVMAQDLVLHGLASSNGGMRDETVWFLLHALNGGRTLPAAVLAAIQRPEAISRWEAFGRELLVRSAGSGTPVDAEAFLKERPNTARLRSLGPLRLLTPSELAALGEDDQKRLDAPRLTQPRTEAATARTIQVWTIGLIQQLATAARCQIPAATVAASARVTYRADGRPKKLEVADRLLSGACKPVFQALLMTMVSEVDRPVLEDESGWVLLPLGRQYVECVAQPATRPRPVGVDTAGAIRPPRKVRDKAPVYPESAQEAGQQGAVVLDAVLTDSGCTRDLFVTQTSGAHLLDLSAIEAVSQWSYEPTLLDGSPVPVRMTVTVNYTLR